MKVAEDNKGANDPKGIWSKLGGNKSIVVLKAKNEGVKWKVELGMEEIII